MKRVVILIDGQNLFYGLKDMGVLEKVYESDLKSTFLKTNSTT
jgi:hypothetical protein